MYKGMGEKYGVDDRDQIYKLLLHFRKEYQHGQAYEQNGGTDFAGRQGPRKHFPIEQMHKTYDTLKAFFDHKQKQDIAKDGVFYR